eukprot:2151318-Rhodomonas_salina.2
MKHTHSRYGARYATPLALVAKRLPDRMSKPFSTNLWLGCSTKCVRILAGSRSPRFARAGIPPLLPSLPFSPNPLPLLPREKVCILHPQSPVFVTMLACRLSHNLVDLHRFLALSRHSRPVLIRASLGCCWYTGDHSTLVSARCFFRLSGSS